MPTIEAQRPINELTNVFTQERATFIAGTMINRDIEMPMTHDRQSAMLTTANFQAEPQSLSTREGQRKIVAVMEQQRRARFQTSFYGIKGAN